MSSRLLLIICGTLWILPGITSCQTGEASELTIAPKWKNGPPVEESYFPIAVWLQDPRNAARYKAAGINLYIGLWQGPTSNQLAALQKAGMPVICSQNRVALENKDNPIIIG